IAKVRIVTINDNKDGPRYLKSIAQIVDYDISTHEKTNKKFAGLQKIICTCQQKETKLAKNLSNAIQKFIESEKRYTMKIAKCTQLQKKLNIITTQFIDARAHYKVDLQIENKLVKACAQRVDHAKYLNGLDTVQFKIIQLQKQLVEI
ncbi:hypothetical protein MMC22_000335, partial [Lobaria immixta]|nr:hypothetical protein [Lobaria immixta]